MRVLPAPLLFAMLAACANEGPTADGGSTQATSEDDGVSDSPSSPTSLDDDGPTSAADDGTEDGADDEPATTSADDAASSDDGTTGWTPPADCGGGALADLAASIEVGTFVPLATEGLTADLISAGGGHHVLQYSDKGVWDPNTCQALFTGGGHLSLVKFLAYSASENTWFQAPNPSWWCETTPEDPYACSTHAYGHNALDPATGSYWFRSFNSAPVHRTQVSSPISAEWDESPPLDASGASCIASALEYFPELGGLVFVDCTAQTVQVLYDGATAWETLPGTYPMGPYHNYAKYSEPLGRVLFGVGNGSDQLYLLDESGAAEPIAAPPRQFHSSPDDPSTFRILTADPISGRFLAIAPNGDMFEYDADTDAWTQLGTTAPENLQIAISVSTYGVVLFVSLEPAMYVYRHTAP